MRLDLYLVKGQWFTSRTMAAEAIRKGWVMVDGIQQLKPSFQVDEAVIHNIDINTAELCPYVSRGGLKLEKAIHIFHLDFTGKLVFDIGASTGGFTDCALRHGAEKVWAVDIGTSQLHASLKENARVISLENTDIREFIPEDHGVPYVDFVVCDVSFISLQHIIPHLTRFLKPEGLAVLLVKPQFEAGPQYLNKSGLVKDIKVHIQVLRKVDNWLNAERFKINQLTYAPLHGKAHNIEYLILVSRSGENFTIDDKLLSEAFVKNGW